MKYFFYNILVDDFVSSLTSYGINGSTFRIKTNCSMNDCLLWSPIIHQELYTKFIVHPKGIKVSKQRGFLYVHKNTIPIVKYDHVQ
jgi:hypothetical protein